MANEDNRPEEVTDSNLVAEGEAALTPGIVQPEPALAAPDAGEPEPTPGNSSNVEVQVGSVQLIDPDPDPDESSPGAAEIIRPKAGGVGTIEVRAGKTVVFGVKYTRRSAPGIGPLVDNPGGGKVGAPERINPSISGLPPGSNDAFSPEQPRFDEPVTVTITTSARATPPDTYSVSISGTVIGTGEIVRPLVFSLRILPPIRKVKITLGTGQIMLSLGGSAEVAVNISRRNFNGPVTLQAMGVPPGVNAVFDPTTTTGNASKLRLTLVSTESSGEFTVKILVLEVLDVVVPALLKLIARQPAQAPLGLVANPKTTAITPVSDNVEPAGIQISLNDPTAIEKIALTVTVMPPNAGITADITSPMTKTITGGEKALLEVKVIKTTDINFKVRVSGTPQVRGQRVPAPVEIDIMLTPTLFVEVLPKTTAMNPRTAKLGDTVDYSIFVTRFGPTGNADMTVKLSLSGKLLNLSPPEETFKFRKITAAGLEFKIPSPSDLVGEYTATVTASTVTGEGFFISGFASQQLVVNAVVTLTPQITLPIDVSTSQETKVALGINRGGYTGLLRLEAKSVDGTSGSVRARLDPSGNLDPNLPSVNLFVQGSFSGGAAVEIMAITENVTVMAPKLSFNVKSSVPEAPGKAIKETKEGKEKEKDTKEGKEKELNEKGFEGKNRSKDLKDQQEGKGGLELFSQSIDEVQSISGSGEAGGSPHFIRPELRPDLGTSPLRSEESEKDKT